MSKCEYRFVCKYYNEKKKICKSKPNKRKLLCEYYILFESENDWIKKNGFYNKGY